MAAKLWSVGTSNAFSTTLNGSITDSDTSIILTAVTGLTAPGVLVIDRINSALTATPNTREYISFTGISSLTLTGVSRGVAGSTAQAHSSGATVEETLSATHWNDLLTFLAVAHDASGNIDTIGSGVALPSPVLTTPQLNDTSSDHQYITAVSELTADRTVTMPLLTGNDTFVFNDHVQTLTNKRITSRVQSVSDAATVTPTSDTIDLVDITAIAQAFTIANPTGTPTNGQKLLIRWKDNATARAITWGDGYVAGGAALPTTTTLSKIGYAGFIYNTANSLNKWQCVVALVEA